jgi:hypothetical protein
LPASFTAHPWKLRLWQRYGIRKKGTVQKLIIN